MPLNITVSNPVFIYGDPSFEQPSFLVTGNVGGVSASVNAGIIGILGANEWLLTPPNQTRPITFTATDDVDEASATVQIYSRFPLHAYFPHNADIGQKIEYSESEDKDPDSELASVRGSEYIVFNYVAKDRPLADYQLLRDFLRLHRGQYFYYLDLAAEETLFCRADSDLRRETAQFERFDLTVVLIGKIIKNTSEENIGGEGEFIVGGGGGVGEWEG